MESVCVLDVTEAESSVLQTFFPQLLQCQDFQNIIFQIKGIIQYSTKACEKGV